VLLTGVIGSVVVSGVTGGDGGALNEAEVGKMMCSYEIKVVSKELLGGIQTVDCGGKEERTFRYLALRKCSGEFVASTHQSFQSPNSAQDRNEQHPRCHRLKVHMQLHDLKSSSNRHNPKSTRNSTNFRLPVL
jgi:hypothetical protein